MTKQTVENINDQFTFRYRASCETCSFRGNWHNDKNLAYQDANKHKQEPGNSKHIIPIETEQTEA